MKPSRWTGLFLNKTSSQNVQIDPLDGLRAVAVLLVLFSHMCNAGLILPPFLNFSGAGKYGVYLFFVLSAFLLTGPFLKKHAVLEPRFLMNYMLRRTLRIYPLFIVVLASNYVLFSVLDKTFAMKITAQDVISHLLLLKGKDVLWSIPVEFKYYLILPFLAFAFVFILRNNAVLSAVLIAACISWVQGYWNPNAFGPNSLSIRPYLSIFLLGSFAALLHHKIKPVDLSPFIRISLEAVAMAAFLGAVVAIPSYWGLLNGQEVEFTHFSRELLYFGVVWSIFVFCLLNGCGVWRKILSWRPLRFIGVVSFSVYLWHLPVIRLVKTFQLDNASKVFMVLFLTLLISSVSFLLFERPFSKIHLGEKRAVKPAGHAVSLRLQIRRNNHRRHEAPRLSPYIVCLGSRSSEKF